MRLLWTSLLRDVSDMVSDWIRKDGQLSDSFLHALDLVLAQMAHLIQCLSGFGGSKWSQRIVGYRRLCSTPSRLQQLCCLHSTQTDEPKEASTAEQPKQQQQQHWILKDIHGSISPEPVLGILAHHCDEILIVHVKYSEPFAATTQHCDCGSPATKGSRYRPIRSYCSITTLRSRHGTMGTLSTSWSHVYSSRSIASLGGSLGTVGSFQARGGVYAADDH